MISFLQNKKLFKNLLLIFLCAPLSLFSASHPTYPHHDDVDSKWISKGAMQCPNAVSFAFNIGLGLLYFYRTRGNLSPIPQSLFSQFNGVNFGEIKRLGYNRTPLFEASIGYQVFPWLKTALVYNGQSNISVESQFNSTRSSTNQRPAWATFRSNLQLYSILLKVAIEPPKALKVGSFALSSYAAVGIGPSWQSWTNPCVYLMTLTSNGSYTSVLQPLRQKITPHALWTGELGLNIKPAFKNAPFTLQMGCKYIDWGGSGSIGVQQKQGTKMGPFKPVSVQKVYSFVPFIGIQFNF